MSRKASLSVTNDPLGGSVVTESHLFVTNDPLGGPVVTESHLFVTNVLPMVDLSTGGWYFVDGRCFEGCFIHAEGAWRGWSVFRRVLRKGASGGCSGRVFREGG